MINQRIALILLLVAALAAIATALAHLSCIYFGPVCYAVQMAPPFVVESAEAGTWLAPVGTVFVSALFLLLAAYALSAARLLKPMPLARVANYTISLLCIVRGLLPLQLWLRQPDTISLEVLLVGLAWLAVGLCYFVGFKMMDKAQVNLRMSDHG